MEYFTFQNIFTNKTFFKDIFLLQPGYFGVFSENKITLDFYKYWDFKFNSDWKTK